MTFFFVFRTAERASTASTTTPANVPEISMENIAKLRPWFPCSIPKRVPVNTMTVKTEFVFNPLARMITFVNVLRDTPENVANI